MSGYYLCEGKRAKHPYRIEGIEINLYTIEELCFYLRENVYLIDETLINERLCRWLEDELELSSLALRLRGKLKQEDNVVELIKPIFREIGYLSKIEQQHIASQIASALIQPEDQRRKHKADSMVQHGAYGNAIHEYYRILQTRNQKGVGAKFFATVLNNMAAAYARLFLFEEAADCLWQSYGMVRSGEVWRRYLAILPLYLSEKDYQDRVTELKVAPEQLRKVEEKSLAIIKQGLAKAQGIAQTKEYWEMEKRKYCKETKI